MNLSVQLHPNTSDISYNKQKVISGIRKCNKNDWDQYYAETEESDEKDKFK